MKIYLAHPIAEYNTPHEEKCEQEIRRLYPGCDIINPKIISKEECKAIHDKYPTLSPFITEMTLLYCPLIYSCEILAFVPTLHGPVSTGVQYEIAYAKRIGRKVIQLFTTE